MIETIIPYRKQSIGSMDVRRVLPFRSRRSVGPFVFLDDFGPVEIVGGTSLDVLAHPHIGLATVTYLFSGNMTHRDSLGTVQKITPGDVNLMNAGRGIVHSERASDATNVAGEKLIGLQTWLAIPENMESGDPSFAHHSSAELPVADGDGKLIKIVTGEIYGMRSPVTAPLDPLYAECTLAAGASLSIPKQIEERSVYVLSGSLIIDGQTHTPGNLVVFLEGTDAEVTAVSDTKFMLLGGPKLEKPRFMWWNFVATSHDLIEQARTDWKAGNFAPIPNESGFVPLPEGNFPKPQPL